METVVIELLDLKFRAFHGFYKKEQSIGSFFLVNLKVVYDHKESEGFELSNCIDYESLFKIVQAEMMEPRKLMETICSSILYLVKEEFPFIKFSKVEMEKCEPPILKFNGKSVKVSLQRDYETN